MTAIPDHRSVFDSLQDETLLEGLEEVFLRLTDREEQLDKSLRQGLALGEVSEKMFCSICQCPFENREEQMEHYKLDWHRFNLRQKLVGRSPVTVEDFEKKTSAGDMSSISGSDSEGGNYDADWGFGDDDDSTSVDAESPPEMDSGLGRLTSRVLFRNSQGQYLSVFRCVLHSKKLDPVGDLAISLLNISNKSVWVVLMTGGGHFAGAVFQGKEVLQHKTFHRYTVRAKRGTAQGLRDSQNRGHAPKSAGAALRRYNEAALVKDVQELLQSWSEHLREASAIFLRIPSYNRAMFFGVQSPLLSKTDPRVRTLPFATRRATFREVKRVHELLSTLHVYGTPSLYSPPLRGSGQGDDWGYALRDAFFTACKVGDLEALQRLLQDFADHHPGGGDPGTLTLSDFLNAEIDYSGFTLLHVASAAGQRGVVRRLMDAGSDPAHRDKKGRTPYAVAAERDTRNEFRRYMAEYPDKYDYSKAQVPAPLTGDIELKKAEKKRAQKATKKQREKEQKEEQRREEAEQEERRRFAALSDREKRALAAERRLEEQLASTGGTISNIRRCWWCGDSLLGKVPFHYLDFSFCSTCCLQEHRKSQSSSTKP
uniref:Ankyrin repeat and zinc finger peptidyl tRNA hydrolase 1 n=1 Tax=Scleropages formosus TaxID=113540 RepID=A0A8C9RA52_SCLFO